MSTLKSMTLLAATLLVKENINNLSAVPAEITSIVRDTHCFEPENGSDKEVVDHFTAKEWKLLERAPYVDVPQKKALDYVSDLKELAEKHWSKNPFAQFMQSMMSEN